MKIRPRTLFIAVVAVALLTGAAPLAFWTWAWWRDGDAPLPHASAGRGDASRLTANRPSEVIAVASDPADAERQLAALVRRAAERGERISIAGARHSMGGHTFYPGGVVLDMLSFNRMEIDEVRHVLHVGAGARWAEIIPFLDRRGLSVAVMQSNNDFTVGGSLSVNCHGWQHDSPPISSTVESFRLLLADGSIRRCSREENPELFRLALGGYGLFGVILDAELRVVPNEFYAAEAHQVAPEAYARVFYDLVRNRTDVGMVYGRISVAPTSFLREGTITLLKRRLSSQATADTLAAREGDGLKRIVFRAGEGSALGKELRWWAEKMRGETSGVVSRNELLQEPADLYATRDPDGTDILHEYFIPGERAGDFVAGARTVLLRRRADLMNITVRNVAPDPDTFLRYAHEEVFGFVMLFHQKRGDASEEAMATLTRELIDVALGCGGTYYLPYRPHATPEQFEKGYPEARAFFEAKARYDPGLVFQNTFFLKYGQRFIPTAAFVAPDGRR